MVAMLVSIRSKRAFSSDAQVTIMSHTGYEYEVTSMSQPELSGGVLCELQTLRPLPYSLNPHPETLTPVPNP